MTEHKWVKVATAQPSQTLHLKDWSLTNEVYEKYKCKICGKEEIRIAAPKSNVGDTDA